MKIYLWLIFIFLFAACTHRKETVREIREDYTLIKRFDISCFDYYPDVKQKISFENSPELYLAEGLLRLLDTGLIKYNFHVTRSSDVILTPQKDTITVDVYNFNNASAYNELAKHFADSMYIEKFISMLKPPFRGLYFMNDSSLSVVMRGGLEHKVSLRDSLFKEFMNREKKAEMKKGKGL